MSVKLDEEEKVPKNERNKLSEKDQYLSKKIANNIDKLDFIIGRTFLPNDSAFFVIFSFLTDPNCFF